MASLMASGSPVGSPVGLFQHRHQIHARMWVVQGTNLASQASRHAHVHLVAQFSINAMGGWGSINGAGAGACVTRAARRTVLRSKGLTHSFQGRI